MKWDGRNSVEIRHDREAAKEGRCECGGGLMDTDWCVSMDCEADCALCAGPFPPEDCEGIVVKKVCRDCGAKYKTE